MKGHRVHRRDDLERDAQSGRGRERPARPHPGSRGVPIEMFGHENQLPLFEAEVVKRRDVELADFLRDRRFALEQLTKTGGGSVRGDAFQRHFAASGDLVRAVGDGGRRAMQLHRQTVAADRKAISFEINLIIHVASFVPRPEGAVHEAF